jgi:hypothetical protein
MKETIVSGVEIPAEVFLYGEGGIQMTEPRVI